MKKSTFIVQFILGLALLVLLSFVFARPLFLLLDWLALVVLILFMMLPVFFVFGIKKSLLYWGAPFDSEASVGTKKKAILFFRSLSLYSILASIATAISILLLYSGNMDDTIGHFWGSGWISIFYGLLMSVLVLLPLKFSLEKSLIEEAQDS